MDLDKIHRLKSEKNESEKGEADEKCSVNEVENRSRNCYEKLAERSPTEAMWLHISRLSLNGQEV